MVVDLVYHALDEMDSKPTGIPVVQICRRVDLAVLGRVERLRDIVVCQNDNHVVTVPIQ